MHSHGKHHPKPFGPEHAARYDAGLAAGYHATHEAIAATMAVELRGKDAASLLCVGVGTAQELLPYARHGAPAWRFTGVDTSPHMLAVARERLAGAGLLERTQLHAGSLQSLQAGPPFDGAQMVGVLHHVEGEASRLALLGEVARRLEPGAPFIIGERPGDVHSSDGALLTLLHRVGLTEPRQLFASPQLEVFLVRSRP